MTYAAQLYTEITLQRSHGRKVYTNTPQCYFIIHCVTYLCKLCFSGYNYVENWITLLIGFVQLSVFLVYYMMCISLFLVY